jgi:Holliday junction resolvasome RuvABC endonuclease subunit
MIIRSLVIDQGTINAGFAVIDHDPACDVSYGVKGRLINSGTITMQKADPLHVRIEVFKADLTELITAYKPHEMVYEQTMHMRQRSADTNLAMGALIAAMDEVCFKGGLSKYRIHPASVKVRLAGSGKASKEEVKRAVMSVWGNPVVYDDNHSDALGNAYYWLSVRGEVVK